MGVRSYDYFIKMNLVQTFVTHLASKIDIFIIYRLLSSICLSVSISVCLSVCPSSPQPKHLKGRPGLKCNFPKVTYYNDIF